MLKPHLTRELRPQTIILVACLMGAGCTDASLGNNQETGGGTGSSSGPEGGAVASGGGKASGGAVTNGGAIGYGGATTPAFGGSAVSNGGASGVTCGSAICGADEYCCNASCSICSPLDGGCTTMMCQSNGGSPSQGGAGGAVASGGKAFGGAVASGGKAFGGAVASGGKVAGGGAIAFGGKAPTGGGSGIACGSVTCGVGEYCCDPSCSRCAPTGSACIQGCPSSGGSTSKGGSSGLGGNGLPASGGKASGGSSSVSCGSAICGTEEYCCNASCNLCTPIGSGCVAMVCEGTGGSASTGGGGAAGSSTFPTAGTSGYQPCAGKSCGASCTLCPPASTDCIETGVTRSCDQTGNCTSLAVSCG